MEVTEEASRMVHLGGVSSAARLCISSSTGLERPSFLMNTVCEGRNRDTLRLEWYSSRVSSHVPVVVIQISPCLCGLAHRREEDFGQPSQSKFCANVGTASFCQETRHSPSITKRREKAANRVSATAWDGRNQNANCACSVMGDL